MKKCPYCAEEIQDAAIVCRYCNRDIVLPAKNQELTKKVLKFIASSGFIILGMFIIFPLLSYFGLNFEKNFWVFICLVPVSLFGVSLLAGELLGK